MKAHFKKTISEKGEFVRLDCPTCGAEDLVSRCLEENGHPIDLLNLASYLLGQKWVRCGKCKAIHTGYIGFDRDPDDAFYCPTFDVMLQPSTTDVWLSFLSLFACWIPFVGPLLAGIAIYLARGKTGWPHFINGGALVLSCFVTIFFGLILTIDWLDHNFTD